MGIAEQAIEQFIQTFEARIETLEQINATLFQGYIELATMVEGIIAQIVQPLDEEAAQAFAASLTENRREMFEMVRHVADGMVASENNTDAAVDDVAE